MATTGNALPLPPGDWVGSDLPPQLAHSTGALDFDFDASIDPSVAGFGLGARYQFGGNFFGRTPDGTFDDFAVWNEALAANDIADLASGTVPTSIAQNPFDVQWSNGSSGLWDVGGNWSSAAAPSNPARHDTVIGGQTPLLVIGSAEDRQVRSLLVSGSDLPSPEGSVELRLEGGRQLSAAQGVTIGPRGRISGSGAINAIVTIQGGGELMAASGDVLAVGFAQPNQGIITSLGTITFSAPQSVNTSSHIAR